MSIRKSAFLSFLLALCGLVLSGWLGFLHVGLMRGDLLGGPFCGTPGGLLDCYSVTASRYSHFLGIPLAFWGTVGYLAAAALALIAWQVKGWGKRGLTALAALSVVFLTVDAFLLSLMIFGIGHLCSLCLLTYCLNFLLAWLARIGLAKPWPGIVRRIPGALRALISPGPAAWIFWPLVVTGLGGMIALDATIDLVAADILRESIRRQMLASPPVSVNVEGDPLLGPADAPFQMVEFMDYRCPICRDAAATTAVILALYGGEVSLRIKHFPLDRGCNRHIKSNLHPGACRLAAAAECAHRQGRFWVFHNRLMRGMLLNRSVNLDRLASDSGLNLTTFRQCMASGEGLQEVQKDIEEGARLGVTGTPTTFLNGILIRGTVTLDRFKELLRALRQKERSASDSL